MLLQKVKGDLDVFGVQVFFMLYLHVGGFPQIVPIKIMALTLGRQLSKLHAIIRLRVHARYHEHLNGNKKGQTTFTSNLSSLVAPTGIEPVSSESESEILSIKLRSQILIC
jgi:hypothetical protein